MPPSHVEQPSGWVYWVTGLSGAGKTTVATLLRDRFRSVREGVVLLDGDRLREVLAPEAGHSPDERKRLALTYARLCRELAEQGLIVVCATISMFNGVREWNRTHIPNYREIYLRVPSQVRVARDPKGLYRGNVADMVGVDIDQEEPVAPDLIVDNHGACTPQMAARMIWDKLIAGSMGGW